MPKSLRSRRSLDWHPEDVKAAVRKTGITLTDLAAKNGLHAKVIINATRRVSAPAQQIIARHLGLAPQTIWPSRYQPDGSPKLRGWPRGRRRNAPNPNNHSQNGETA
jgi:Ner family transcriptional regulator